LEGWHFEGKVDEFFFAGTFLENHWDLAFNNECWGEMERMGKKI
jgi:hypothetical protein